MACRNGASLLVDPGGMLGVLTSFDEGGPTMQAEYDGRKVVGIDLHRRRSVIVRMTRPGSGWTACGSPTIR
jgi:hypothetical protein